jgi:hypothetical protein
MGARNEGMDGISQSDSSGGFEGMCTIAKWTQDTTQNECHAIESKCAFEMEQK